MEMLQGKGAEAGAVALRESGGCEECSACSVLFLLLLLLSLPPRSPLGLFCFFFPCDWRQRCFCCWGRGWMPVQDKGAFAEDSWSVLSLLHPTIWDKRATTRT